MKDFNSVRGQDNTFLWEEGRLVFMCIGKAANSSVKAAILQTMGGVNPEVSVHFDDRINYISNNQIDFDRNRVVAVVRHPTKRLASFWQDKIANRDACNFEHLGLYPGMSFERTVEVVTDMPYDIRETHLTPQSVLLSKGKYLLPEYIYMKEGLSYNWSEIQKLAAVKTLPDLPWYNRSSEPGPRIAGSTRQLIADYYASDFKTFGYERP